MFAGLSVPTTTATASTSAAVRIDCASIRWALQPTGWVSVLGQLRVSGDATRLEVFSADTPFSPEAVLSSGTTVRDFFVTMPTYSYEDRFTLQVRYRSGGTTLLSAPCPVEGYQPTLNDFFPEFVGGQDRYATAVKASQKAFPGRASSVVIASGADFADALSAGPAAAGLGAPLLLVAPGAVPDVVAAEIRRLAPTTIYVVGGEGAVSRSTYTALSRLVSEIHRIAGADRYATSRAVYERLMARSSTAFIASGASFADAVSATAAASVTGAPVLLVPQADSPTVTGATIRLLVSRRTTAVTIVGGTGAVPRTTERALAASVSTSRIGGADRYETSVKVNQAYFDGAEERAYLTVGSNFPDALAGSTLAAATGSPLMITRDKCVPDEELLALAHWGVTGVTIVGGNSRTRPELAWVRSCLEVDFFASYRW